MLASSIRETMNRNKFFSLVLLRRAILEENYEACAALIASARYYKASAKEIRKILASAETHPENIDIDDEVSVKAAPQKVSER
jgi:hypothetical protein